MEKKPEKIIYNPEEHVSLDVDKSETGNEWMRNPESFASLQAIVDAEKAQIIAEQINKEANSLFTDFAEATAMLAVFTLYRFRRGNSDAGCGRIRRG